MNRPAAVASLALSGVTLIISCTDITAPKPVKELPPEPRVDAAAAIPPVNLAPGCGRTVTGIAFDGTYYYVGEGHGSLDQCITRYTENGTRLDVKHFSVDMRGLHFVPATGMLTSRTWAGPMFEMDYASGAQRTLTQFNPVPSDGTPNTDQSQPAADPDGSTFWVLDVVNQRAERRQLSDNSVIESTAITRAAGPVPALAVSNALVFIPDGPLVRAYDKSNGSLIASLTMPNSTAGCNGYGFGVSAAADRVMYSSACNNAHVEPISVTIPQAITFTSSAPSPAMVGSSYTVTADGGTSGNEVIFSSLTSSTCTVDGNVVALIAGGACTVAADQTGGNGWEAAPQATQTFTVTAPLSIPPTSVQLSGGDGDMCALRANGTPICWGDDAYGKAEIPASLSSVAQISAGGLHNCALETDGTIVCWGRNVQGESNVPGNLGPAAQVVAGYNHSCALKIDGMVVCWGADELQQSTVPQGLSSVVQISSVASSTCALKSDGTVVCWGHNGNGQTNVPQDLTGVSQIVAGGYNTCALKTDGAVVCWGSNDEGQSTVPGGLSGVSTLSAGYYYMCALKADGTVTCWGANDRGQTTVPADLASVTQIGTGGYQACGARADGTVVCWTPNNVPVGLNLLGTQSQAITFTSTPPDSPKVGDTYDVTASGTGSGIPVTFSSLTTSTCTVAGNSVSLIDAGVCTVAANQAAAGDYTAAPQVTQSFNVAALLAISPAVGAGTYHTCALKPAGTVACWGLNDENRSTPPAGLGTVAQLSVGNLYNCALLTTSTVNCWGRNVYGSTSVPAGLSGAVQLSAGGILTCVLKSTGTVQCWGSDTDGQLNPPAGLNAAQVSAGGDAYGCALKTDATVVCWGFSGDGRTTVPVGLTNVRQISAGYVHTCAVRTDGTVVCWGPNPDDRASVPVGLSNVTQVSAGSVHTCAVKSDGKVVCWGVNTNGQASPPLGLSDVQQVSAGASHTCAYKTDGTIVCWGSNSHGQLNVPADLRPLTQPQTITFTSTPPSPALVATSYDLSASGGGSGNPVVFSSLTTSVCTVSGSTTSLLAEGTCMIAANQAGASGYDPAPQNTQAFTVSMGSQAIVFTSTPSSPTFGGTYELSATGGASGNPVTFASLTTDVCTVSGSSVSFVGAGSCTIAADQAGNANYNAAPQATQTFTVAKAAQLITLTTQPPNPAILGNSYAPAASSSSGLPVTFTTLGACSFSAGSVQFGSVGSCTLTPHAAGNANYLDADGQAQTFPIVYNFTGFLAPVSNAPVVNTEKAGAIVRIKFTLGGDLGVNVLASGSPISGDITGNCATTGTPATTTPAVASAPFKYDPTVGQYIYSWQTDATWIGTCRQFVLTLADGTVHAANFQFSPPDPTVSLTVTPTDVVAGVATTLTFTATIAAATAVTSVGGLPCALPAVTGGVTYQGSCTYTQTWSATGKVSYVATATILGRAESFPSNTATVSVVKPKSASGLQFGYVSVGEVHSCGVTTAGVAYCWGFNNGGQLGNGTFTQSNVPVAVSGGYTFTTVSAASNHSCGVTTAGAVYCWGYNANGELGNGTLTLSNQPVAVSGGYTFSGVSVGNAHSCGLTKAGAAYCWGNNPYGQLGNGTLTQSKVPVAVSGGYTFTAVSAGTAHSCGVTKAGAAYCWGYNYYGALGNGAYANSSVPVPVSGGYTFTAVSAANLQSCGITKTGAARCWGYNSNGQLGNGTITQTNVPVAVSGGYTFTTVRAGGYHSCGVITAGAAYCWGYNAIGQLGNGTFTQSIVPVPVSGGLGFASASAAGYNSCGVTTAGAAYCWGNNANGQLGNGTYTSSTVPVPVSPP